MSNEQYNQDNACNFQNDARQFMRAKRWRTEIDANWSIWIVKTMKYLGNVGFRAPFKK